MQFCIETKLDDYVSNDRAPRKKQHPEGGTADFLLRYSDKLLETATAESRKPLPRMKGLYSVRAATENTASIDKDGLGILVSLEKRIGMR